LSSSLPVRYGVPQGSVLGPLLFILYVNDIPSLTQGKTFMYADETTIMNVEHDINELQKIATAKHVL
jgi:mannose/fructose/N-acetylgalactosamine-specific phosphotransferase system component IID